MLSPSREKETTSSGQDSSIKEDDEAVGLGQHDENAGSRMPRGPVPDGGLHAWLAVFGSWVALFATWGIVNSFGPWLTFYEKELLVGVSASTLSWIGSLQAALLLLIGPISGALFDNGYFTHLLWTGLSFIVVGLFLTSICTSYWQLLLSQGCLVGVGCGLVFTPSTAILSQYFHKRRALAIGLASTGSPIAGVMIPVVFGRLVSSVGFGWATRCIAFILLALSSVPLATMRPRVPPTRIRSLIDKHAFADMPFLVCSVGVAIAFLTLYVPYFYIQLFGIQFNISSPQFSYYLVTIMCAGSILGRIAPNYAADEVGSVNMMTLVTFCSGVSCLAWLAIRDVGGLATFAFLYGVFSGGIVSVTPSAVVCLTPDLALVGTRMGMTFFMASLAVLVGPPIAGVVMKDNSESAWLNTIGYSGAALLIGSVVMLISRVALFKRDRSWRA